MYFFFLNLHNITQIEPCFKRLIVIPFNSLLTVLYLKQAGTVEYRGGSLVLRLAPELDSVQLSVDKCSCSVSEKPSTASDWCEVSTEVKHARSLSVRAYVWVMGYDLPVCVCFYMNMYFLISVCGSGLGAIQPLLLESTLSSLHSRSAPWLGKHLWCHTGTRRWMEVLHLEKMKRFKSIWP